MELDINNLLKQLHSISQASLLDEDARARILKASQALCQRLETPYEWVLRMTWQEVSCSVIALPTKNNAACENIVVAAL